MKNKVGKFPSESNYDFNGVACWRWRRCGWDQKNLNQKETCWSRRSFKQNHTYDHFQHLVPDEYDDMANACYTYNVVSHAELILILFISHFIPFIMHQFKDNYFKSIHY